jgi:glucosylceramidase
MKKFNDLLKFKQHKKKLLERNLKFNEMKNFIFVFVVSLALSACNTSEEFVVSEWVTTTENEAWKMNETFDFEDVAGDADVVLNTDSAFQTIEGFGGSFNELGWTSLSALSENDRAHIFKELFKPGEGANFTVCRMPLGANDFSLDWYSYNEVHGDFEMEHFSVENDLKTLIPYIKSALQYNPDLKIWASPWSPPAWMKWNKHYACATPWEGLAEQYQNQLPEERQGKEGTNMFIQEAPYFKAYALYFSKFIEAYKQQGIDVAMVMPQNEFNSCQIFPSCTWTSAGLATFIGEYLGPEMEKTGTEIMFGTMERPAEELVDTVLNDPLAGRYITGVGFQWAGKESIARINERYPDMKLYQTEQECGDGKNDWAFCTYAWGLMKHFLSHGTSAYLYWNMSLPEGGVSRWGWSQNSLVTVDTIAQTYKFNHEFYLMKHFSHYINQGAQRIHTTGAYNDVLAFKNPDHSVILIAHNGDSAPKDITVELDRKRFSVTLAPKSFNTFRMVSE